MTAKYFIITPNGRSRLKAKTDGEAVREFNNHYALISRWVCKEPKATLVKQEDTILGTVDLQPSGFGPNIPTPRLELTDANSK